MVMTDDDGQMGAHTVLPIISNKCHVLLYNPFNATIFGSYGKIFLLFTLLLKSISRERLLAGKDKRFERPRGVTVISVDNDLTVRPLVLPSSNEAFPFVWQTCFRQTYLRKMSTILDSITAVRKAISNKKPFCTGTYPLSENAGLLFFRRDKDDVAGSAFLSSLSSFYFTYPWRCGQMDRPIQPHLTKTASPHRGMRPSLEG